MPDTALERDAAKSGASFNLNVSWRWLRPLAMSPKPSGKVSCFLTD